LLALSAGEPITAYYRISDQRRGQLGELGALCLASIGDLLYARGELLYAAAAYSAIPGANRLEELEEVLVELRIPHSELDELVSRAGIEFWTQHLEAEPGDAVGWTCLAQHALTSGRRPLAARAAERAIELDQELPDAHAVLATLAEDRGDLVRARQLLERGASAAPDAGLLCALGEVLERLDEDSLSLQAFERALDLEPELWAALEGRRRLLEAAEDWEMLADHLERMSEHAADLDQADLLRRERHRICVERLGQGERVFEERRHAARERRRAEQHFEKQLAEALANAPPESERPRRGSPLWVLVAALLTLALVAAIAALR
jgi:tetratricopeptide (TPR) repeat protein